MNLPKINIQKIKDDKAMQVVGITIGVYLVIAFIVYLILINAKFSEVGRINTQIREKKEAIRLSGGVAKQKDKIKEAKEQIEELKQQINYYEAKLPTEKDIPQILQYLSQIANESGVKLLRIEKFKEVQEEKEQTLYVTVPLSLDVKGGYHSIGRFVNKIETAQRFMKVQDFEIKKDKKTPLEHQANILLYTYMLYKEEPEEQAQDENS